MVNNIVKIQLIMVLVLAVLLGMAAPAYAQPPPIPEQFWGTVTLNSSQAPQGTTIAIKIGGTQVAQTATDAQGKYGLMVSGSNGALVEFYVNGTKAQESTTFTSGKITALNLTVPGSGSLPPPATTPPPAPTPPAPTPPTTTPPPASTTPAPTPSSAAPSSAASFVSSNLNISPAMVKPGEKVTITVDVKNTGSTEGSYKLVLKVNGSNEAEQTVILGGGKTQKVTFATTKQVAGNYNVAIDGRISDFTVSTGEASPTTGWPWWIYVVSGVGVLLVIMIIITLIRRRNAYYC